MKTLLSLGYYLNVQCNHEIVTLFLIANKKETPFSTQVFALSLYLLCVFQEDWRRAQLNDQCLTISQLDITNYRHYLTLTLSIWVITAKTVRQNHRISGIFTDTATTIDLLPEIPNT